MASGTMNKIGESQFLSESRFRAMGTDAHLIAYDAPDGWERVARELLTDLEARWSRFRGGCC